MHNQLAEKLNQKIPAASARARFAEIGDSCIFVESKEFLSVAKTLKEDGFNVLQVITGTDYKDYLELTYILADFTANRELLLKTTLDRGNGTGNDKSTLPQIASVTSVWSSAHFQERETYDMIGVNFVGNPDLRRILTPDDWQGYPLRKDYVVQEKYLGMVVNPPGKINTDDHMFGKKLKEEVGDPKKVSVSWKGLADGDEDEDEAKDGE